MKTVGIVGSGPAGLTAAIYVARGGFEPIVVTGQPPGGPLMTTTDIENFPGFPTGIPGPDLIENMRRQAERLGARMVDARVDTVQFEHAPLQLFTSDGVLAVDAVILAVGAAPRWLGLDAENRLRGRGVSTCATCDGFFFRGQDVVVVGGGDAALEEASFLARLARQVTVLVRGPRLRASHALVSRVQGLANVSVRLSQPVQDILGDEVVTGVRVPGEDLPCRAVFIAIGQVPSTDFLRGQVALDDDGYIVLQGGQHTSAPGVFAAGDVYDRRYKQAVTAAASGCKAALDCIESLERAVIPSR